MVEDKPKPHVDRIILISLGILAFVSALLIAPNNILLKPDFEITISENELEKVTIKNQGWIQAKNVRVTITGTENLNVSKSDCPEEFEIQSSDEPNMLKIHLDRVSSNLECSFTLNHESTTVTKVIITSDDAPSFSKQPQNPTQKITTMYDSLKNIYYLVFAIIIITIIMRFFLI